MPTNTEAEWPAELTRITGARVRRYRKRKDMSAGDLAEALTALGYRYTRAQVTNLEAESATKRRTSVSVGEVLAFAAVLGVPPILLLFPLGEQEQIEALPDQQIGVHAAMKWFTGEVPRPVQASDGHWGVSSDDFSDWQETTEVLGLFRRADELYEQWNRAGMRAKSAAKQAEAAGTDEEREAHHQTAEAQGELVQQAERSLAELRRQMRRGGVTPPELTPNLRHVDDESEE